MTYVANNELITDFLNSDDCVRPDIVKQLLSMVNLHDFLTLYDDMLIYNYHLVDRRLMAFRISIDKFISKQDRVDLAYENRFSLSDYLDTDFAFKETLSIFSHHEKPDSGLFHDFFELIGTLIVRQIMVEMTDFQGL